MFTSDHGDMLGDHRLPYKWLMYEGVTRVPPLVWDTSGRRRSDLPDALVSHLDIGPTLLDAAGLARPTYLEGTSLFSPEQPARQAVFCEDNYLTMVRTAQWKYVHYAFDEGIGELYDLEADPDELDNLFSRPEAAGALSRMRLLMLDWLARSTYRTSPARNGAGPASRVWPLMPQDGEGIPELEAEAAGYLAEGYTGVKIKLGGLTQAEDAVRVAAVRKVLGPGPRLMIDAAGAYDAVQAERFAALVSQHDLYFFEAPIRILDSHGLGRFRARTSMPIAAHEGFFGLHAYDALIRIGAVDFVQFNVTACGGLTEAHRIAARADADNLATTLQYSGSFVGFAASVQLAATLPRCDSLEVHMVHQGLKEYRDGEEWQRRGSFFHPGERPGIGLSDAVRQALLQGD